MLPDISTPLGHAERLAEEVQPAEEIQLLKVAYTTMGRPPIEAGEFALRAVYTSRMHMHLRRVRRASDGLQFVSKQFSVHAFKAVSRNIDDVKFVLLSGIWRRDLYNLSGGISRERLMQADILGLREHSRRQEFAHQRNAYPELEEDVEHEWLRNFDRLAMYLDDFNRSLAYRGVMSWMRTKSLTGAVRCGG